MQQSLLPSPNSAQLKQLLVGQNHTCVGIFVFGSNKLHCSSLLPAGLAARFSWWGMRLWLKRNHWKKGQSGDLNRCLLPIQF